MNIKKLLAVIAMASMLTSMNIPASAADPVMPDQDGNVSIGSEEITIGIEGRVESVTLAATCNISTYLSIDPNQPYASQFLSPVITVSNDSNAPITLYTLGVKATGAAPKIVSDNKYTEDEWKQLNRTQTNSNIALGLLDADDGSYIDMWFAEESEQQTTELCDIPYQGEQKMKLQAKFGRAWDGGENFKYGMTLKIGLQQ